MPETRLITEMAALRQSIVELTQMVRRSLKNQQEAEAKQARTSEVVEQLQNSDRELQMASVRAEIDVASKGTTDTIEVDECSSESELESKADGLYLTPVEVVKSNDDDQTDFHSYNLLPISKVRWVKPPAKPPDDIFIGVPKTDIVWFDVGTDIISYRRNAHKVFDMLFRVYAESKMFDKRVEGFDYMVENGTEIDERACMVLLLALKRADQVDMSLKLFRRMVDANVPITVYSMTIAVEGLCRKGETDPARVLINEMSCLGFKANAYSYNTLVCAYIEKGDFVGVDVMLKLMKRASALFDEMVGKGLEPTATALGALINGACKAGQVEAADARVEDEADSLPKVFAAAVKARRKDFLIKTKVTVCGGGDGSGLEDGDVLVFPDMVVYSGLKESDVEGFVEDVLVRGEPWSAGNKEEVTSTYVFVCARGSRDKRCGVCGPVLLEKLKEEIEARGLSEQVVTSPCSHIGGHRYAGNLIFYGTDPTGNVTGHWYGYVTPDDVAELLDTHIGKGEIIEKPWRGQMGTHEGGQEVEQTLPNGKEKEKKEKKHKEEPKLIEKEAPSSCCQGVNGVSCCRDESPEVKSKTVNNKVMAKDASGMQIQLYQMKEIGRKQKNDEKEVIEGASCCSSFFPTCDSEDHITVKHLSVQRHLELRAIIFETVETHFDLFDTEKKEYELFDMVDMRDDPKSFGKLDYTMQTMEELLEEAVALSTISVRMSKFLIISSPRSPEDADLEDKINFKEGGMLRTQISQSLGSLMQYVEVLTFGYK
ncbi:unnamed protein product [Rhodiola kirilowii]